MKNSEFKVENNKKQNFKKNLIISLMIIALVSILVFVIGYFWLDSYYSKIKVERKEIKHNVLGEVDEHKIKTPEEVAAELKAKKEEAKKINILLMGTDKGGYLTDSILLLHYNTYSKSISLVSIPRDYRIQLSKEVQKDVRYHANYIKLTELNSYAKSAGIKSSFSYTAKAVEEMLNLEIDHVILFEIPAFRKVVDAVGGVEVYVPQNYNYEDPTQNLYIHLKKGMQELDGKQAEGLVRYRQNNSHEGYGDFGRMEIQQYFFSAFLKKAASLQNVLNITEIAESISEFINTDATLNQAISLVGVFKDADLDNISSHTLPGEHSMVEGKYFYVPPKSDELKAIVKEWFELDSIGSKNSKKFKIYVKNSSNTRATCDKIVERLTKSGYNAVYAGEVDEYSIKSKIVSSSEGVGLDLKKFLNLSDYSVDEKLLEKQLKDTFDEELENEDTSLLKDRLNKSILIIVGKVER